MKLITEHTQDGLEILVEKAENGSRRHFIQGVFMQAEQKNRNGRVYPHQILEREVSRYGPNYIAQNRSFGELGHPDGPTINPHRISHIITNLRFEGNDVVGKAKITNTPYGNIVANLLDDGAKFGVSSRGLGSLKTEDRGNIVQEDFNLITVDIVADPSAPKAFVDGIMEGREWIWNNGALVESTVDSWSKAVKAAPSRKLEETTLKIWNDFLRRL